MNLIAKEFWVCRIDDRGILILSEFCRCDKGANRGALLVYPYDTGVVSALQRALCMGKEEEIARLQKILELTGL